MATRRRSSPVEDGERLANEIFGPDPRVRTRSRLPPLRHPDERSPFPSDYFFAIGVNEHGICSVVLTARRYWESSHAQSDWHLTPLIGHLLPRGFEELMESTFETSFGTDGTYAALLERGFLAGPPEFQEYFGCTLPESPHPDALLRDGGPRPPPLSPPPTRRSRVDWDEEDERDVTPLWNPPAPRSSSSRGVREAFNSTLTPTLKKSFLKKAPKEPKPEPPRPTAWQHILGDDPYEDD